MNQEWTLGNTIWVLINVLSKSFHKAVTKNDYYKCSLKNQITTENIIIDIPADGRSTVDMNMIVTTNVVRRKTAAILNKFTLWQNIADKLHLFWHIPNLVYSLLIDYTLLYTVW